jgi:hypothetical protein
LSQEFPEKSRRQEIRAPFFWSGRLFVVGGQQFFLEGAAKFRDNLNYRSAYWAVPATTPTPVFWSSNPSRIAQIRRFASAWASRVFL